MADRRSTPVQIQKSYRPTPGGGFTVIRKIPKSAPKSTQFVGILTLLISGGILLVLTGMTVSATLLGLILFAPLILLSSPVWIPVGAVLFVLAAGFLSTVGFGVAVAASLLWMYRYFKGTRPSGSSQFHFTRGGGHLESKVKNAAPGA